MNTGGGEDASHLHSVDDSSEVYLVLVLKQKCIKHPVPTSSLYGGI